MPEIRSFWILVVAFEIDLLGLTSGYKVGRLSAWTKLGVVWHPEVVAFPLVVKS